MQALAIIVAFWLILVAIYAAYSWLSSEPKEAPPARPRQPRRSAYITASSSRPPQASPRPPASFLPQRPVFDAEGRVLRSATPRTGGEVEVLRAQVEQLRSELVALSSTPRPSERPRRTTPGSTSYLPRPLRRQVREVRTIKRLTSV